MAASTQPEPQTTSTPNTTQSAAPSTETKKDDEKERENIVQKARTELMSIYDGILAENESEKQRLQRENEELRRASANPPNPQGDTNLILERPRDLIREEIRKEIAPLLEFAQSFRSQSQADLLIQKFSMDPRFSAVWPAVEPYIRRMIPSISPLNDQTMLAAVMSLVGAYYTNQLDTKPSASPQPQPNNGSGTPPNNPPANPSQALDMNTPPHLRPSAPPSAIPQDQTNKRRELTELEKRLAREKGMSPEKYLDFLEMKANQVVGPKKMEVTK